MHSCANQRPVSRHLTRPTFSGKAAGCSAAMRTPQPVGFFSGPVFSVGLLELCPDKERESNMSLGDGAVPEEDEFETEIGGKRRFGEVATNTFAAPSLADRGASRALCRASCASRPRDRVRCRRQNSLLMSVSFRMNERRRAGRRRRRGSAHRTVMWLPGCTSSHAAWVF